jgi:ribonucleoside-triphosphate reductase
MNEHKVVKRDGTLAEFDEEKIINAVAAAFESVGQTLPPRLMRSFIKAIGVNLPNPVGVEEIQNRVERYLMDNKYFQAAKSFILYREKHKEDRILKDRLSYMMQYVNSKENAATSSEEDSNANVSVKNVANLNGETYKNTNRRLQRMWMRNKLKEMFPEVASQYEKDLESHIIYTHDESSFPVPTNYCEAVSLYPLLMDGTSSMDGLRTTPPHNLNSFCGQLINLTFLLAAQCKGAVAFGEFFNFFDYFCVKEWGPKWHMKLGLSATTEVCEKQRTVRDIIIQAFQQIVYSWNQPAGNRSYQSPFINISYFDSNYWKALFEDFVFPDGSKPEWERVDVLQRMFLDWFNSERKKTLLTFPVETMSLLTDGEDVIDKDYKKLTCEMWAKGHSFFLYNSDSPDNLASCCRLRNELGKNEFSFTNGLTGIRTGSCNVITLNLSRIIQNFVREKYGVPRVHLSSEVYPEMKEYLGEILDRVYKYHTAYKTMLYELEEAGMLTASKAGYIYMQDLFSTIGINGLNDAAEFIGLECNDNPDYELFVQTITGFISEQNRAHSSKKFRFNQEFVPAEQLSSRNYNWDKENGYWVNPNRNLYNSYIYLADDEKTSILDRIRLHGKRYTGLMDGGVGCHNNLSEHLSEEQYAKVLEYAIKEGCSYYTFNVPNTECLSCGHIEKIPVEKCPVCGSTNLTHWVRVIGYLRPVRFFDKYRREEEKTRVYHSKENLS